MTMTDRHFRARAVLASNNRQMKDYYFMIPTDWWINAVSLRPERPNKNKTNQKVVTDRAEKFLQFYGGMIQLTIKTSTISPTADGFWVNMCRWTLWCPIWWREFKNRPSEEARASLYLMARTSRMSSGRWKEPFHFSTPQLPLPWNNFESDSWTRWKMIETIESQPKHTVLNCRGFLDQ